MGYVKGLITGLGEKNTGRPVHCQINPLTEMVIGMHHKGYEVHKQMLQPPSVPKLFPVLNIGSRRLSTASDSGLKSLMLSRHHRHIFLVFTLVDRLCQESDYRTGWLGENTGRLVPASMLQRG